MRATAGQDVRRVLVSVFIAATIGFLIVLATLIVIQPNFPLDVGFIRTTGRAGLLATLAPALAGIAGLALSRRGERIGSLLVAAYSAFWAVVFLGGLPQVWNARRSFCLKGLNFCITSPWVARLTLLAIAIPFLLCAAWALRRAFNPDASGAGTGGAG